MRWVFPSYSLLSTPSLAAAHATYNPKLMPSCVGIRLGGVLWFCRKPFGCERVVIKRGG